MRILRTAEHRRMPWRNGGGVTAEVAVHPDGAGFADFGWRLSMATVLEDGLFSVLPGVRRILALVDGPRLVLEGAATVELTQASAPFAFDAGMPIVGRVPEGPVVDLNLMFREPWRADVARLDGAPGSLPAGRCLLVLLADATAADGQVVLSRLDVLDLSPGDEPPSGLEQTPLLLVALR